MIGIKDRRQFFNITDVSLKLNRFRETDFSPIKSTLKGAKDYESPPKP